MNYYRTTTNNTTPLLILYQYKLNSLYVDLTNSISVNLKELTSNTDSFLGNIKYKQPWLADLNFSGPTNYSDGFIEYALTDIGYRNTAKLHYEMYYKIYIPKLKEYRAKSLEIIDLINEKLVD